MSHMIKILITLPFYADSESDPVIVAQYEQRLGLIRMPLALPAGYSITRST